MSDISDADLIADLHRITEELGTVPAANQMAEHSVYGLNTFRRRFGSWNDALNAAELPLNYRSGLTTDDLLEELHRLADELGHTPTQADMTSMGNYGVTIYRTLFGSWNNALETAGLELNRNYYIDEEDLMEELLDLAEKLGRSPMMSDMRKYGEYDVKPYQTLYGSWNDALREANLPLNQRYNTSKSELLEGFKELADDLGKRPTAKDMMRHGEYDWKSYRRAFGSWDDAVLAAGYEPYEVPSGPDNHLWVDGYDSYYGPNWDEERERAIQRDGESCSISGCDITRDDHLDQFGRDLPVHHIERKGDFRKEDGTIDYEEANKISNLITVCSPHHKQYEGLPLDTRHLTASD